VIRVYDAAGNVIETHEHKGDFKEWWCSTALLTVQHRLRCSFAQFKLCVHFLQVRSQFCDLLFQLLNRLVLFWNL